MAKRKADAVETRLRQSERSWETDTRDPTKFPAQQGRNAAWYEMDNPQDLGRELEAVTIAIEARVGWRRYSALRNLRRTDARPYFAWGIPLIEQNLDGGAIGANELRIRLAKSMIETFVADTCGGQRPKPQFLTTGADWQLRRKAKKLDRFVYGLLSQRQGKYHDCWELGAAVIEDAMRWTAGIIKVHTEIDRVAFTRVYAHDILVDPIEAYHGEPKSCYQLVGYDRNLLMAEFPEYVDDIKAAPRYTEPAAWYLDQSDGTISNSTADNVKLVEAWHLPSKVGTLSGKPMKVPGRHVVTVGQTVLVDEEWTRDYFPFVFCVWSPDPMGVFGCSLVDEVQEYEDELCDHAARMQERERLLGGRRVYYPSGTIREGDLAPNEAENHIGYDGQIPPTVEKVEPLNDQDIAYLQTIKQMAYELMGISIQQAAAKKDAGLTAAVAIREATDLGSKRQAVRARRMWEMMFVELGRRAVDCVCDLAEDDPDFNVRFAGRGFLDEIKWSEIDLDADEFTVSVAAASSLPQDPAGRLQTATDLFSSGLINAAVFKRLLDWPDLEGEQQRDAAEFEYVEWVIDRYLDASDADIEAPDFYQSPEGFFTNMLDVIGHVAQAYFVAKREGAPPENLELLSRYIQECQSIITNQTSAMAAASAGAAPGGPTAAPGAPGGEPMAPPGMGPMSQ